MTAISLAESLGLTLVQPLRSGAPLDTAAFAVTIAGCAKPLAFPLFWHDPPWHLYDRAIADQAVAQAAEVGLPVAALRVELNSPPGHLCQILPYRPDRFGVTANDFDFASIVDLRLTGSTTTGNPSRYHASQLRRWGTMPDRIEDPASIDAPSWPSDVNPLAQLPKKVEQLRRLSNHRAAIWVTVQVNSLARLADPLRHAAADCLVLDCRSSKPRAIRQAIAEVASWKVTAHRPKIGVTADLRSFEDIVLLMALGADWVAVDSLLQSTLANASVPAQTVATVESSFFYTQPSAPPPPALEIRQPLLEMIEDCWSLIGSLGVSNRAELDLSVLASES